MSLKSLKLALLIQTNGLCEYCKSPANISSQPFVVEHIIPKSKGGKTIEQNLALSCQGCNNYKYNKTRGLDRVTGKVSTLFHPRRNIWAEHFAWSDDGLEIIGTTSIGRATVEELKLNRKPLINLRLLLVNAGLHPPG